MTVVDVVAAEDSVKHLIVEQNGSTFLVHWNLRTEAAAVTTPVLVWCSSHSSLRGCEVT